jgi:ankyrin repeat protein
MRQMRLMVLVLGGMACCTLLASCVKKEEVRKFSEEYSEKLEQHVKEGRLLDVRYDLEMGANPNGDDAWAPLYRAINRERPDIMKLLVAHGADVNARTSRGTMPLHHACQYGRPKEVVLVLLEAGADVNGRDLMQRTPLHWATEANSPDLAALLLERGADIDAKDELGWTPLKLATMKNSTSVRDLLLKHVATE